MGETIAEGNLELETVKDVTIRAKKTAVKGNLAVNAENGYGVEITSEGERYQPEVQRLRHLH